MKSSPPKRFTGMLPTLIISQTINNMGKIKGIRDRIKLQTTSLLFIIVKMSFGLYS